MQRLVDRRSLLVATLGAAAAACAQTKTVRAGAEGKAALPDIEPLVRHRILEQRAAYAAVVATLSGNEHNLIVVRAPGAPDHYPLGEDTIFEVASLTKIFTALLLATEVVNGRAQLDDPLGKYVPEGVAVARFEGREIMLADLATHGSALPLRPSNLAASAPDAPNKYAAYTLEQLYAALPGYQLDEAPGLSFRYSNLAFALLGQGLAQRQGMTFAEALRRRVLEPLGLEDTSLEDDPAAAARRAAGHDFYLERIGATSYGALAPAGGLRSSAHDLVKLLMLFLGGKGPRDLVAAARLMLTVDRPGDDENTRMALGWRRTRVNGETYYWSNGSGDGSRTFMGFNPARNAGVVALADAASGGGLDDVGRKVLDPATDVNMTVVPRPVFVDLQEAVLLRATGTFEYAPDDVFVITRGVTGLILTAGFGQLVIRPVSPTRYASIMAPGIWMEFEGVETGPATALILHQDDQIYRYRRVD